MLLSISADRCRSQSASLLNAALGCGRSRFFAYVDRAITSSVTMSAVAAFLAFAVPFFAAVACSSTDASLAATEFAAKTLELQLTPASLFARAVCFIPIGSIGLRLAFASAAGLGLMSLALYRAIETLLRTQGVHAAGLRSAVAVGLCWIACSMPSVFALGTTPGGHAITAALLLLALGETQRFLLAQSARRSRRLGIVAAVLVASGLRFSPPFGALWSSLASAPLFAALATLGAIAIAQTSPRSRKASDVARALALRRVGWMWSAAIITYTLPVLAVLVACLCGALLAPDTSPLRITSRKHLAIASFACTLGLVFLVHSAARSDTTFSEVADAWAANTIERMPPRTLYLPGDPQFAALARSSTAELHTRPDLRVAPLPALADAAFARHIAADPSLRPLVRSYLLQGELPRSELESLRAERPVFLDLTAGSELHTALRPAQLSFEVAGSMVGRTDKRAATDTYLLDLAALTRDAEQGAKTNAGRAFLARLELP